MPVVISCVNLKGGVGKTAISVNTAAFFGKKGKKTLLIDLDPQTNATFSCMSVTDWQKHSREHGTVANLLELRGHTSADGESLDPKDIIKKNAFRNVDLLPSHLDLVTIDLDMGGVTARETKLKRALAGVLTDYDVVVCDCPPNLTIPTQNALALSSHYLVPVSPDYLSVLGVALLVGRIAKFGTDIQHDILQAGIVLSRIGRPAVHRSEAVASLRSQFGASVFTSQINERVAVSEAAQSQKSIFQLADRPAANEFEAVASELAGKVGLVI